MSDEPRPRRINTEQNSAQVKANLEAQIARNAIVARDVAQPMEVRTEAARIVLWASEDLESGKWQLAEYFSDPNAIGYIIGNKDGSISEDDPGPQYPPLIDGASE